MKPTGLKPVASPVSASRLAYRSLVYLRSSVDVSEVEPNVTIRPGGVPRGARGELVALDQHRVGPAEMAQVVGDGRADDAAADDDDTGAVGKGGSGLAHDQSLKQAPASSAGRPPGRALRANPGAVRSFCCQVRQDGGVTHTRRICIIGGGPAGLSAALALTDPATHPNWRDEYEVTVLQMGWRAGGKGATGRSGVTSYVDGEWRLHGDARIEEHGIHLFGNMYVNSLRTLDGCLAELQPSVGEPVSTMQNELIPSNYIQLADYFHDRWHLTPQHLPNNDLEPWGAADYPTPKVLIRELLRLGMELLAEALGYAGDGSPHRPHAVQHLELLRSSHAQHARAAGASRRGAARARPARARPRGGSGASPAR